MVRFLLPLLLILACEYNYDVEVRVTGTAGTRFAGTILTTKRGVQSVNDTVPAEWRVPVANVGDTLIVQLQKDSTAGFLEVWVWVSGGCEAHGRVAAPGGVVRVVWFPGPS
ncbi:MAG: hypothetical protein ABIK43_04690 [candidate division WOR-3 bacterium]